MAKMKILPKLLLLAAIPLVVIVLIAGLVTLNLYPVYTSAKKVVAGARQLEVLAKAQNLPALQTEIPRVGGEMTDFQNSLNNASWLKAFPYAGRYWQDADHGAKAGTALLAGGKLAVDTIAPYADIVGLGTASKSGTASEKAQDRIAFVVSTIDKLSPQFDIIGQKLAIAQKELDQIDAQRYPEEFQGQPVRSQLTELISVVDQASLIVNDAKPVLGVAPWLLGNDKARTYLILFQNDAELRPTGGFWTGYALIKVQKGKLTPLFSGDIYDLDAKYAGSVPAPKPLIDYIADPYKKEQLAGKTPMWRLRDMNLSPDFRVAVEQFLPEYLKAGGMKADGVIAIDSQVLVSLLRILGPVGVPGYGNFSADRDPRCNCPSVIYQLESIIGVVTDYFRENRKGVLGPLMHSVLANAIGSPKSRMPALFEAGMTDVMQKHVLFYFPDPTVQAAMESFNLAGRVRDTASDYLFIVDANMGGAKANLYIQQEVTDTVVTNANTATHTLIITYKNPQKYDAWLNAPYRDWFRLYVPKGTKLLKDDGSEIKVKSGEDLGKTTIEGFFTVRPEGVHQLSFNYTVPLPPGTDYSLLIQKQAGTAGARYTVSLNGRKNDFTLLQDKELR
jgi:hypothetical protein